MKRLRYIKVDNSIFEERMSPEAKLVLFDLLSYNVPDDSDNDCKITVEVIMQDLGMSEYMTKKCLKELKNAGHLKYENVIINGRFAGVKWHIYDIPNKSSNPRPQPQAEEVEISEVTSQSEYNFNRIWDSYPAHRRGDRKEALKAFNKIPNANDIIEDILKGLNEMKRNQNWLRDSGQWIPSLKKFLENRIWEEGLNNPSSIQGKYEKALEVFKNAGY